MSLIGYVWQLFQEWFCFPKQKIKETDLRIKNCFSISKKHLLVIFTCFLKTIFLKKLYKYLK